MAGKIIVKPKASEEPPVTFRVGDTVRLKSGGPSMVVEDLKEDSTDLVVCVYFDHAGNNFHRVDVSVNVLMHFKPKF